MFYVSTKMAVTTSPDMVSLLYKLAPSKFKVNAILGLHKINKINK